MAYDFGSGATGALSGAAAGSSFGPVGTAVGAVGGGLLGLFGSKKKKPKKIKTFDKTQQGLYKQYAKGIQGKGPMGDLFNFNDMATRDNFQKSVAEPAYQNFNENIIPSITGQFRGQNLQNSSYLGGALSKAGTDVQKGLDANLSNMIYQGQQNSIDRRLQSLNGILGMQTFAYQKPQASGMDNLLSGFASGAGNYAGQYAANKFMPGT